MFTVSFMGQTYICHPEENLLEAARKSHIPLPVGCCSGGCGMCRIKVVKGTFALGICSKAVLSDGDREANYTLACKTYPSSNMEVTLESI